MQSILAGLLVALVAVPSTPPEPLAPQEPAAGWQAEPRNLPTQTVFAELSTGELVAFDGRYVERLAPDGTPQLLLADLGGSFFAGILAVDPSETFAVVGESSLGNVYRVPLDGSGESFLANVFFNYDAAYSPSGDLYVSAATGGFSTGNQILTLDPLTGQQTVVAQLQGPSGPIGFDSFGNLYYGTQTNLFPAPSGSTEVLLWTAGQLASGSVLDEGDALGLASGFDGAGSLVVDRQTNLVYIAENNFLTGTARVRQVIGGPSASPILYEAAPFETLRISAVHSAPGPEALLPYQPAGGGRLFVGRTDFGAVDEHFDLEPRRPLLSASGAGLSGVGAVDVAGSGFPPGGLAFVAFGPSTGVGPELVVSSTPPLLLALDSASLAFLQPALPVDASGDLQLPLFNPGGLQGLITLQALAVDTAGLAVGTSHPLGL